MIKVFLSLAACPRHRRRLRVTLRATHVRASLRLHVRFTLEYGCPRVRTRRLMLSLRLCSANHWTNWTCLFWTPCYLKKFSRSLFRAGRPRSLLGIVVFGAWNGYNSLVVLQFAVELTCLFGVFWVFAIFTDVRRKSDKSWDCFGKCYSLNACTFERIRFRMMSNIRLSSKDSERKRQF